AVEVELGLRADRRAFERALDEIDASAGTVEVIAEHLIARTGRGAKAAMHALAQDVLGLPAFGGVADEVGEPGLHVPLYFLHEVRDLAARRCCDRRTCVRARDVAPPKRGAAPRFRGEERGFDGRGDGCSQ